MFNFYTFAFTSIAVLIKMYADFYRNEDLVVTLRDLEHDANLPRPKVYDFIIVGGGGAGCVLANRLSKFYNVLLLDAGGTPVPATDALVHYNDVRFSPHINYLFQSVPQTHAARAYGGIILSTVGKMLGGSTAHNGLIFNRGHPSDFDNWAALTNDTSWRYDNVLKYFIASEMFVGSYNKPESPENSLQHGETGPITVDTIKSPLLKTWFKAGAELGYKMKLDPNGPQVESFAPETVHQRRGRRVSSFGAYIKPIEGKRKNLRIERYSNVSEILFSSKGRANGVAYYRHNFPQIARARKEVIIAAGPISTPILLMKSGIGPRKVLESAGIPVVKDLPVGVGLREHPSTSLPFFTVDPSVSSLFLNLKRDLTERAINKWFRNGSGPWALSLESQAFIVSKMAKSNNEGNWPDILLQIGQPLPGYGDFAPPNAPAYWFGIILGRPKSAGVLNLNVTAYLEGRRRDEDLAIIDYNLLAVESDRMLMLEGIKLYLKILENTKAFEKFKFKFTNPNLSACAAHKFRSDDFWLCYIQQTTDVGNHITSSCPMGFGVKDTRAVVDSKLNVLGIHGLRIVDASIVPALPNANIVAAVLMIAEKASTEILGKWKRRRKSG